MEEFWKTPEFSNMEPTPRKINIDPENDGLVQMIFLDSRGPVFSGSMSIFWGVTMDISLDPRGHFPVPCLGVSSWCVYFVSPFWDGSLFNGIVFQLFK